MQLIGSSSPIEFTTDNLSENGLLLQYKGKDRLILNKYSILETWLHVNQDEPIFFFTKLVRYKDPRTVAVKIIDIDNETQTRYLRFLDDQAIDVIA
jgi:hypothetical protein